MPGLPGRSAGRKPAGKKSRGSFACGEGDLLPLLGEFHPIRQVGPAGYREGVFCLPGGSVEERRAEAVRVYKELAARLLRPLLESYAPVLGVTPAGLKIGSSASRRHLSGMLSSMSSAT